MYSQVLANTLGGVDFSNILSKSAIERLAQADEFEVVREVQVSVALPLLCATLFLIRISGILRRLRANTTKSILLEPHADRIKAAVWFIFQYLGSQGIGPCDARHHICPPQLEEETYYQIREDEPYGEEIRCRDSGNATHSHLLHSHV
jgi:hypothetical protein